MSSISYNQLGDKLFVNFTVGGQARQTVLPNTPEMRESLDRVIKQES